MLTTNRRLSPLNPLSWSLWVKLIVAFTITAVVLTVPIFFLVREGILQSSLDNAIAYTSENGTRQVSSVTNALERARDNLETFVTDSQILAYMRSLLLENVRSNTDIGRLPGIGQSDVQQAMEAILLNPATSLFDNVRLLDSDGRVVASAGQAASGLPLVDQSTSEAFLAASAEGEDRDILFVVSLRGFPVIEYVAKVRWHDGTPIGYLIGQVSNSRALYANMRFRYSIEQSAEITGAFAFLTTPDGLIFSPIETRPQAQLSLDTPAVRRGLEGGSGIETYTIGTGDQTQEVVGYYAPISGTPLILVSQIPTVSTFQQTLSTFTVPVFVVGIGTLALIILLSIILNQMVVPALARLRRAAQSMSVGDYELPVPEIARGDEIGMTATAFTQMRSRVKAVIETLEDRVAERTRDIEATQEISRTIASERDLQRLMDNAVNLIVERFPSIYHAQIFLIDSEGLYAVVRSSTGEVGRQLMERGHRLAVGSVSVIGQVTDQGKPILARDASVSQVHRRNEFLPDTRSELAIPLRIGEQIIGALDVQSKQSDAFPEDLQNILQTMADQIAIAIQNARLYEESVRRVREIEDINRQATQRAWQEYMNEQRLQALTREAGIPVPEELSELRQRAVREKRIIVGNVTSRDTVPLAVPVQLRGQVIGAVEWEIPSNEMSRERMELAQELANRLAISLDNARLFQESRRATERERLVNTIAARLTTSTNVDQILQTAVREVGQALRAPAVSIQLKEASALPVVSSTSRRDTGTLHDHGANAPDNGANSDATSTNAGSKDAL